MRKLFRMKKNILICLITDILPGGMGRYPYAAEVVGMQVSDSYVMSKSDIGISDWSEFIW